jgi:two-component system alkaline phosphatase synthesis response regulator PhoP
MSDRVLVVDDEDDIREIARLSLERLGGWTVVTASSGDEAVELVAREAPFTVVLLDVMMPGSDGPATLQQLRSGPLDPQTPVVFLTAKVQPADRRRLHELGAAGVIAKPFDPTLLSQQLRAVLESGPGEIS